MKNLGIYIHIPFCIKKCLYCDFVSYENCNEVLIEKYLENLINEIEIKEDKLKENNILEKEERLENYKVNTIYIGCGTPSYIDSKYIVKLINILREKYNIEENCEITIEVNPRKEKKKKIEDYKKIGINRISIGLQETNNNILKTIGRIHTYEKFLETYNLVKESGFENINVDLMIGLPTQTMKDVENSLNKIIKLDPKHISIYSLILEEGTKLEKLISKNELILPEEDIERKMYWKVKKVLEKNGYNQYEIYNFAKKTHESKHTLNCWNQEEYIGFGAAAHSYLNNIRFQNDEDLREYEKSNIIINEKQNKQDKMNEYMILGLRKIEGVNISDFKSKFIENPIFVYRSQLNKLVKQKLIEITENNIKLTKKGLDFANIVWEEFI